MIYMDDAATTKINAVAAQFMKEVSEKFWFNPSSHYDGGYEAKKFLQEEREKIAYCIGASPYEVYFTSGGSESNNWALESIARAGLSKNKMHIISTQIEHHSVLNKLNDLENRGYKIDLIKPDETGHIKLEDIIAKVRSDTCGISVMAVNNELGTIQSYQEIGEYCRKNKILFHVDAVQAVPHCLFNLNVVPIDYMSVSAHKFNGPRGIGFLYVKSDSPLTPIIFGGGQEQSKRAGTENLPAIAGMEVALGARNIFLNSNYYEALMEKRLYLIDGLKNIEGCHITGSGKQIPTIVNFYFDDILGETLLSLLNTDGVYCSAGSACAAGDPKPSHVLKAVGLSDNAAKNSIRLSFDMRMPMENIEKVVYLIKQNVKFIRGV